MNKKTIVETKREIIYGCGLTGQAKNLATDSNNESVTIVYQSLDANDKPSGIILHAKDINGKSVSIVLDPPKKPWESPIGPETFMILKQLLEENKFEEIEEKFFIQEIM